MSGIDKLFTGMRTAASGLTAERTRIDVIAENIANARTTRTPEGGPYRRKTVVFEPLLASALAESGVPQGVSAARVERDFATPTERILDPGHPDAGPDGMVEYPTVNAVVEMADLITALRAYEANLTVQENFMQIAERALQLAR
jgi:flagellar basal-body rod protein FlgC